MLDVEVLSMAKVASWLELARAHLSMPFYFICLCCKKQEASTKRYTLRVVWVSLAYKALFPSTHNDWQLASIIIAIVLSIHFIA